MKVNYIFVISEINYGNHIKSLYRRYLRMPSTWPRVTCRKTRSTSPKASTWLRPRLSAAPPQALQPSLLARPWTPRQMRSKKITPRSDNWGAVCMIWRSANKAENCIALNKTSMSRFMLTCLFWFKLHDDIVMGSNTARIYRVNQRYRCETGLCKVNWKSDQRCAGI